MSREGRCACANTVRMDAGFGVTPNTPGSRFPRIIHDFDRSKLCAYANAGVKECWLVLGPEKTIEVHRQPERGRFAASAVQGPGGTVSSTTVPGVTVDLERLFAA